MSAPEKFTGFQSPSAENWLDFQKRSWVPRPFGDHDVDVKIECCGVCATDVHVARQDWGETPYPVVRVGAKVTLAGVGQRVGIGAQVYSCGDCRHCKNHNETYCKEQVCTYGAPYPGVDHYTTQGGYSSHARVHEYWIFPIPDSIPSSDAAPMMCAGATVFSPLKRFGAGPGAKVGVIGIGGLGHYAIQFAKALGAEVWAISRSRAKEADAKDMGADGFLATSEEGWNEPHRMTFNLIICTASSFQDFHMSQYLSLLDVHGRLNLVGLPADTVKVSTFDFIENSCFLGATNVASRREVLEMLEVAAAKGVRSWVKEIPISTQGIQKAIAQIEDGSVRYRSCLVAYDEAFEG
ncbi:hypothetical protein KVR01_003033 [Diaporthe batatas]|uniref:uncharacterized protein n=1 Tax=Diaporthe batatas TaxID=748121 RepID=UPI001D045318|nr:uncharacterized protein KVR01_003033 [Diaporthe batatas]KAG8167344.1 hypothetical protein KVR01_003033 [Diaporthe batatas]